jgi:hypothetical protein
MLAMAVVTPRMGLIFRCTIARGSTNEAIHTRQFLSSSLSSNSGGSNSTSSSSSSDSSAKQAILNRQVSDETTNQTNHQPSKQPVRIRVAEAILCSVKLETYCLILRLGSNWQFQIHLTRPHPHDPSPPFSTEAVRR